MEYKREKKEGEWVRLKNEHRNQKKRSVIRERNELKEEREREM